MKYSIEIGKIVEGSIKHDDIKVKNYCELLIKKLEEDGDLRSAKKFRKILEENIASTMTPMDFRKGNIPVDSEARIPLADIIYPSQNTIKTILTTLNEKQIKEFIENYEFADKLSSAGVNINNTLLLYGPPGCGKTNCAYMIAKELELPLIISRLDSLISSYLGTTAKNIRALFDFVQKIPCVLFLDEFDAIAKARNDVNELGELKRVVNSLLQNIDNLAKDSIIIAATNHDSLLDSAVWRRFDYKVNIELPDLYSRMKLVQLFLNDNLELTERELKEISVCLNGFSGATIKELINKALRDEILKGTNITKLSIYNQIFLNDKKIANAIENNKNIKAEKIIYLYSKNSESNHKVFTYENIGEILSVTKSYVSQVLNEVKE